MNKYCISLTLALIGVIILSLFLQKDYQQHGGSVDASESEMQESEQEPEMQESEQESETWIVPAKDLKTKVKKTKKELKKLNVDSEVVFKQLQEISTNLEYNSELSEEEHNKVVSLAETTNKQESESKQVVMHVEEEQEEVALNKTESETEMIDVKESKRLAFLEKRVSENHKIIMKLDDKMQTIDRLSRNVQSLISSNKSMLDDIRAKLISTANSNTEADSGQHAFNGLAANGYAQIANASYYRNLETAQKIKDKCPMSVFNNDINPVHVLEVVNQKVGSTVPVVGVKN